MKKVIFLFVACLFVARLFLACKKDACESCAVLVVNESSQLALYVVELDDNFIDFLSPQDTVRIQLSDAQKHRVLVSKGGNIAPDALYREVQCAGGCEDIVLYFNP